MPVHPALARSLAHSRGAPTSSVTLPVAPPTASSPGSTLRSVDARGRAGNTRRGGLRRVKPRRPGAKSRVGSKATLSWLALAFLTLGSVGDLGTAPALAVFGL